MAAVGTWHSGKLHVVKFSYNSLHAAIHGRTLQVFHARRSNRVHLTSTRSCPGCLTP